MIDENEAEEMGIEIIGKKKAGIIAKDEITELKKDVKKLKKEVKEIKTWHTV